MKNIQIIDGADNCTYSLYAAEEKDFELMFPNGNDIEFVEDFLERLGEEDGSELLGRIWENPIDRSRANGIQGTLFYDSLRKREYFACKKWRNIDRSHYPPNRDSP
ncbi:MAG: hypothetical protein AAF530_24085 [Pseudomonadota bacterium]